VKILFLSQRVPEPPNKGDKIRSHHLMRRIASRHAVHLACLFDEPSEREHAATAEQWAASVTARLRHSAESAVRGAASALVGNPMSVGFFRSGALADDIRRLLALEQFDVVVAYCSSMASYVWSFDGPKVLDFVDVDSEKWRQYAERSGMPRKAVYALEHRLLRSYEARLVGTFDRCVIISPREREVLARFTDPASVDVVTNGVDTDWLARRGNRPRTADLVFVGALDYFANAEGIVTFASEAFPEILRRLPAARLRVVGRKPGPGVRALGEREGVDVVGEVDDMRPELWRSAIAVVPLRIAQGLQNKVLEAMAAGIPVVSSAAAVRGVEGREGEHFLVADSPAEWAGAVEGLVQDPARAEELAANALALVRERYSWDRKAAEYEAVLEAAVAARRSPELAGALR
jgi:sugar transferase (PEP-CTERM/EpsH1 system associated)